MDIKNKVNTKAFHLIENNKFDNKLKRFTKILLDSSPEFSKMRKKEETVIGFSQLNNSSNSLFLRTVWGVILFSCFTLCVLQISNRLSYYFSEPIAVDVSYEENLRFPSITVGSSDTAGTVRLLQMHNISLSQRVCAYPVMGILAVTNEIDAVQIWKMVNFTSTLTMASLVTATHQYYNLSYHEEFGPLGTEVRFEVPVDKSIPYNGMSGSIEIRSSTFLQSCSTTFMAIVLLNRRSQKCVDSATYLRCIHDCKIEIFKELPCRLPFVPEDVGLPSCKSGPRMGLLYGLTVFKLFKPNCHCPRQCEETILIPTLHHNRQTTKETVITVHLSSSRVTTITQRSAYDAISLLGDLGGILGLCLGLSLLSILDILQKTAIYALRFCGNNKQARWLLNSSDPIICLVQRIFPEELRKHCKKQATAKKSERVNPIVWLIWFLLMVNCVVGSFVFVYFRGARYWSEPTRMKIEIGAEETVTFPNITVCGMTTSTMNRLRNLAIKRQLFRTTSFNPKMPDWCSLYLPDLLDDNSVNADQLWDESSVLSEYENSPGLMAKILNKTFIENLSLRDVSLPEGKCVELHAGEQLYAGTATQLSKHIVNEAFQLFNKEMVECNRDYQEVFITSPEGVFNLDTRLTFPYGRKTFVTLQKRTVSLWNSVRQPCTDRARANECHSQCFEKKLLDSISCRLPYMPPAVQHLPTCNNAKSGNRAYATYLQLAVSFDPLRHEDCGCVQTCEQTILTPTFYIHPRSIGNVTYIVVGFYSNIYQKLIEVPADSISSLLSDIGGALGLLLDLCLLALFDVGQSLIEKLRHLKTKCMLW